MPGGVGALGESACVVCRGAVELTETTALVSVYGLRLATQLRVHTHYRCLGDCAQCRDASRGGHDGWV